MIRPVRIYESITMLRFGEIGVVGNTADSSTWFSGTKPALLIRYSMSFSKSWV